MEVESKLIKRNTSTKLIKYITKSRIKGPSPKSSDTRIHYKIHYNIIQYNKDVA